MRMTGRRFCTILLFLALTLAAVGGPCYAWIYDGGPVGRAFGGVGATSDTVWATQPFQLASDAYLTGFDAAVAKAMGSAGVGYNVYLTTTLHDVTANSIGKWTVYPTGPIAAYHSVQTNAPIKLDAGVVYFLTFIPNSNNFVGSIAFSSWAGYYALATPDYGQTWGLMAKPLCVHVDGYFVPEPSTWATLLVGVAGLAGLTLVRRRYVSRAGAGRA